MDICFYTQLPEEEAAAAAAAAAHEAAEKDYETLGGTRIVPFSSL